MIERKPIFEAVDALVPGIWNRPGAIAKMDAAIDKAEGVIVVVAPKAIHEMHDKATFYAGVRKVTGSLDQVQVDTIEGLLSSAKAWPVSWLAYGLATAWHECRFKPIEEWGKGKGRPYSKPGKYGQSQHGRGLVQLTWDRNYEWADKAASEAGLIEAGAILKDFSLVMRPDIAAFILVRGMETGGFTGKGLKDYLPTARGSLGQFTASRRIINGTDKATLIAGHALNFQDAIIAGGWK